MTKVYLMLKRALLLPLLPLVSGFDDIDVSHDHTANIDIENLEDYFLKFLTGKESV